MTPRPCGRRRFLAWLGAGASVSSIWRPASAMQPAAAGARTVDSEAIAGSTRWPESFRPREFNTRSSNLSEILELSRRIPDGDADAYVREWSRVRAAAVADAETLEREGRRVTAGEARLRASNYSNRIYNLYLRLGDRVKAPDAYRRVKDLFDSALPLLGDSVPFEKVSFAFAGRQLKGFFFPSPSARRGIRAPVVYRTGGADSVKEGSYFSSIWAPFVNRGVSCLVFDAPGQGEALNLDALPLVPDFERVVQAAVDYLRGRADVDPAQIGLYGTSMGGYFAGRGAAGASGIAAVVLQSVWYRVLEDSYDHCPPFRPHLRYMVGAADEADARRRLAAFTFERLGQRITQPIFLVHGEKDEIIRPDGAIRLHREIASRDKQFRMVPGTRHNLDSEVSMLVDWMCGRLTG